MKTQEQFQRDFALQVKGVAESIEEAACEDYDGLAEYFDDCLDVDFIVSGRLEYRGAKILLACGGPNIYLDTREGCVKGYWGAGCYAESYLHRGAVDAVDEYFEEQFNCLRESY